MVITSHFTHISQFLIFFSPMLDIHFMNLGQIAHKSWLLPPFLPYLPLLGIFNRFRRCLNIFSDTIFKVIVIIPFIIPIYPVLPQFRALIPRGSSRTFDIFFYVVSKIDAKIFSLLRICSRSRTIFYYWHEHICSQPLVLTYMYMYMYMTTWLMGGHIK